MASATQSRSDAVEGDELSSPQEDSMQGKRSTERELRDVRAAIDNLSACLNKLEGRGDCHTGSRLEQSLKEVDSESEAIRLLKVTVNAKEMEIRELNARLLEKDAMMDCLQESLKENRAMMSFLRDQLVTGGEQLKKKDDLIISLQATLEENVAHKPVHEHEIKALRDQFAALERGKKSRISLLEEKNREQDAVIRRKEEMIKANAANHEQKEREMIQKKDDEIQAIVANIRKVILLSEYNFQEKGVPLFLNVVKDGDLETMKAFISMGFDVDTQDEAKRTPLSYAAEKGHYSIVETLLLKGANVDLSDKNHKTPTHWASEKGNVEVVKALIHAGANFDSKNRFKYTPLLLACIFSKPEVVKELLHNGVNVEAQDEEGDNHTMDLIDLPKLRR
ncbi:hypothetical protein BSKO_02768 [Bryopsis sp. KO-2023]|nr:hypothetical protein BSKO_02768 [Bryopsis sp. KO-2023]